MLNGTHMFVETYEDSIQLVQHWNKMLLMPITNQMKSNKAETLHQVNPEQEARVYQVRGTDMFVRLQICLSELPLAYNNGIEQSPCLFCCRS